MRWISAIAMTWAVLCGPGCSGETQPIEEQPRQLAGGPGDLPSLQVQIEARFVRVEDNFLRDIGVNFSGLVDGRIGGSHYVNGESAYGNSIIAGSNLFGGAENTDIFIPGNLNPERPNPLFSPQQGGVQVFPGTAPGRFFADQGDPGFFGSIENYLNFTIGNASYFDASGGLTFAYTALDSSQLNFVLQEAQQRQNSTVISAPRILAADRQEATIITSQYVAELSDFEPEIADQARQIDPRIETMRTGIALSVRPIISQDRQFITPPDAGSSQDDRC